MRRGDTRVLSIEAYVGMDFFPRALPGERVDLLDHIRNIVATSITDEAGVVRFDVPIREQADTIKFTVRATVAVPHVVIEDTVTIK